MPKLKTLKVALSPADFDAIQEAIAIRGSGLFRSNGELILPDREGDMRGRLIAEICRGWTEALSADEIRTKRPAWGAEDEKGGAA